MPCWAALFDRMRSIRIALNAPMVNHACTNHEQTYEGAWKGGHHNPTDVGPAPRRKLDPPIVTATAGRLGLPFTEYIKLSSHAGPITNTHTRPLNTHKHAMIHAHTHKHSGAPALALKAFPIRTTHSHTKSAQAEPISDPKASQKNTDNTTVLQNDRLAETRLHTKCCGPAYRNKQIGGGSGTLSTTSKKENTRSKHAVGPIGHRLPPCTISPETPGPQQ